MPVRFGKGNTAALRHGHMVNDKPTPTYESWRSTRARCTDPKHPAYAHYNPLWYKPWEKFTTFLADMGICPVGMTLDRKDGTLPYSPSNCRWATRAEQSRNRPTSKLTWEIACAIRASSETPVQLAARYGVHRASIHNVLKNRAWKGPK